jgi:hypothetical protein
MLRVTAGKSIYFTKKTSGQSPSFRYIPAHMKSETLNGILTFTLGVLVVFGVILALRLVFVTRETRTLERTALVDNALIARTESLFADANAYNKQYPSVELTKILQAVQAKAPAPTR